jgi:hypothetical protein
MKKHLVGEDVIPSVIPIECTFSLGRFSSGMGKEDKEELINWEITCIISVGRSTLGHDGDV